MAIFLRWLLSQSNRLLPAVVQPSRRFCFGLIALTAFVLPQPSFCNQQGAIVKLADGIGKVDMGLAFKQIVDGKRSR